MIIAKVDCGIYSKDGTDIKFKEFAAKFQEFLIANGYEFEGSVVKGYEAVPAAIEWWKMCYRGRGE